MPVSLKVGFFALRTKVAVWPVKSSTPVLWHGLSPSYLCVAQIAPPVPG